MKITKHIYIAALLFLVGCHELENRPSYEDGNLSEHVHFALILDSNGDPVYDEIDPTEDYAAEYNHMFYDTILVPVSMTRNSADQSINVTYTAEMFGDDKTAHFFPDSILTFGPGQYSTTIEITFDGRWFIETKDSIVLTLKEVNHPDIEIGYPYGNNDNSQLVINLEEILFAISTSKPSSFEIKADSTPSFDFQLDFENGFIYEELKDIPLLEEVENNLDYTLTQHPFEDGDKSIAYTFELNTAVANKYTNYECVLEVADIEGYKTSGGNQFEFFYTALDKSSYTLQDDQIEILGDINETVDIDIIFSSPITEEEIVLLTNNELLIENSSDFQYSLQRQTVSAGDEKVTYTYTVLEDIVDNASELLSSSFALQAIDGFVIFGNTEIEIVKNPINLGETSINPASHFYNHTSPTAYKQLYTYLWLNYNNNGCVWRESFGFCYPVEVEASHPDAVLHDDGNYYHAYRIGYNSPNPGTTTNSFALKHWFDNEYTDSDKSPGFNVVQAMDLFPKDGTSHTEGTVVVVEQDLIISSKNEGSYVFHIKGNGTYYYDEGSYEIYRDSIFSIELDLEVTNNELFGGTRTGKYLFKNRDLDSADKPTEPNIDCIVPTQL